MIRGERQPLECDLEEGSQRRTRPPPGSRGGPASRSELPAVNVELSAEPPSPAPSAPAAFIPRKTKANQFKALQEVFTKAK